MKQIIDALKETRNLTNKQFQGLMNTTDEDAIEYLHILARELARDIYGDKIYIRGLIEFTNYCKNDCYYCGIRRSNCKAKRYRLTKEEILRCCNSGYELGFRTFVLQGGEDTWFTDEKICDIVSEIKGKYSDCAVTLSIGEKTKESYQMFFDSGADRYLLRHETADRVHYEYLHPATQSFLERRRCLMDLKEIGYQVGCGFMVGSPNQTLDTLYEDLMFMKELNPHMIGIGPFIPQKDTPYAKEEPGSMEQTLRLISIIRLMHPNVLLPATTALGTIHPDGRKNGIMAGANVVMPNISPLSARENYKLYDNKIYTEQEAGENLAMLCEQLKEIGYTIAIEKGDYKK